VLYIRGEREKMMAKTEMEDLRTQLEQMTKSKVVCRIVTAVLKYLLAYFLICTAVFYS